MTTVLKISKMEALTLFARRLPNADKITVDYGRDELCVYFGQYRKDYSINEVLKTFSNGMLSKKNLVVEYV